MSYTMQIRPTWKHEGHLPPAMHIVGLRFISELNIAYINNILWCHAFKLLVPVHDAVLLLIVSVACFHTTALDYSEFNSHCLGGHVGKHGHHGAYLLANVAIGINQHPHQDFTPVCS